MGNVLSRVADRIRRVHPEGTGAGKMASCRPSGHRRGQNRTPLAATARSLTHMHAQGCVAHLPVPATRHTGFRRGIFHNFATAQRDAVPMFVHLCAVARRRTEFIPSKPRLGKHSHRQVRRTASTRPPLEIQRRRRHRLVTAPPRVHRAGSGTGNKRRRRACRFSEGIRAWAT